MSDILVKGKVQKEVFKNGAFRILSFVPNASNMKKVKINQYGNISLKGDLNFLTVGEEYEVKLKEAESSKYGTSYEVISVPSLSTIDLSKLTIEESKKILMSFTTEGQANNILTAYPDFIAKVIKEGKASIDVKKIHNVGDVYLSAYCRELAERYKYIAILNKYTDYELTTSDCKALYDEYATDEKIEEKINTEPYYVLIEVLKHSFDSSDKIICKVRPDLIESNERCEAMVMDILHRNENDGSSKLDYDFMIECFEEYDNRVIKHCEEVCKNSEYIYYDENTHTLALMNTYLAELRVSNWVKDKLNTSTDLGLNWSNYSVTDDGIELDETQLKELELFCKSSISLLMGYSGTGKTFSLKQLIRMIEDANMSYCLLSPTGKASRVLSESTGRKATTIHKRCFSGEISEDVIIIDEAGMVSLEVMCMLLNKCVNSNSRFVFVGDPSQIPSISLGRIFEDFLKSKIIPTAKLTKVFRYKSNGSLFVATNVRQGVSFFEDKEMVKFNNGTYKVCDNYKFISENEDEIGDRVVEEYFKLIKKGIKPKDILILAPQNVGDIGTYKINNIIQQEINPPKSKELSFTKKIGGFNITFRTGDIVINTKNDYNALSYEAYMQLKEDYSGLLSEEDVCDKVVVNGQIGIIRDVLDDGMMIQFDEDLIFMSKHKLNQLLLGYAISTFKAQGSTCEHTINIVSEKHKKLLSRGLLYVADTRNKTTCTDIGSVDAYESALRNVVDERKTFLLEMLKTS